ncbi:MAG: NADH-quinone oxidoreductase subunit E [Paracoccaceae bacterium]
MLRRLHKEQPASFAFTPANLAWAKGQITKYPAGRQASAVIPLLWRAQEQEGWLTRAAIEHVADMLGMAYIRALEVATFYFMFQLQPVGTVAHIQICGTTSCMICGAEALIEVCKTRIAPTPHTLSADGKFSWEEVECLGACTNAPMAQIGKDYYEDLTPERLAAMIDEFSVGKVPVPGPQNGRYASEPLSGLTSLKEYGAGRVTYNGSVQRAVDIGDTVKRIDGTEVPLLTPWLGGARPGKGKGEAAEPVAKASGAPREPKPAKGKPADATGVTVQEAVAVSKGKPVAKAAGSAKAKSGAAAPAKAAPAKSAAARPASGKAKVSAAPVALASLDAPRKQPASLKAARKGKADDLKIIRGIGPKLEALLHRLGFFHFDQIAAWTDEEIAWVDENLEGFKGRVTRENWVPQARVVVTEGEAALLRRIENDEF